MTPDNETPLKIILRKKKRNSKGRSSTTSTKPMKHVPKRKKLMKRMKE